MTKKIHRFGSFVNSLNENNTLKEKGETFADEVVSKISSEIVLDKSKKEEYRMNVGHTDETYIRVSQDEILTNREIPSEIYSTLKGLGYNPDIIKKRWGDLYVIKPKDNWGYLVLSPDKRNIDIILLINGETKLVGFYDEDSDSPLCFVWNGKKIIKVHFEGKIWPGESPRDYSIGEYESVKSEDNNKYELTINFMGDENAGYEFEDVEEFRKVD